MSNTRFVAALCLYAAFAVASFWASAWGFWLSMRLAVHLFGPIQ